MKLRPLFVILYAALIGLLLAAYIAPLQQIMESRSQIAVLEQRLDEAERENARQQHAIESLKTPEGLERTARERYGMVRPGEKVYIIPEDDGRP
ncbi:septum formation initiator family protein [Rubrobacter taiwanensis]|uniref:Septum formation initiator family protein n=1 Tax=Rubrobacter taiwanensis TaxID=185139 RepID=A0A4R1BGE6_9ACTN|nr:septum formation initiator family protein [Rubrobacter taiwanensis]TCJ16148.1 septum formation initiator family protein [Rubrobacter taiwanensis]